MVVVKIPAGVKKVMQIWTDTSAADRVTDSLIGTTLCIDPVILYPSELERPEPFLQQFNLTSPRRD